MAVIVDAVVVVTRAGFGSAVALFAICQYLSGTPNFYWLRPPGTGSAFLVLILIAIITRD